MAVMSPASATGPFRTTVDRPVGPAERHRAALPARFDAKAGDFANLLDRPFRVGPVESDPGGAILKPKRAMQRRQSRGQSLGDRTALLRLHLLPGLTYAVAVQVGMPRLHFRHEALRHIVQIERTAFFSDDRMKENLQQQVAELFTESRVVAGEQRFVDLVSFLDQVGTQRLVRLRRIPLAAAPQVAHQRERIFKRGFHLLTSPVSGYVTPLGNDRSIAAADGARLGRDRPRRADA